MGFGKSNDALVGAEIFKKVHPSGAVYCFNRLGGRNTRSGKHENLRYGWFFLSTVQVDVEVLINNQYNKHVKVKRQLQKPKVLLQLM